LFILSLAYLFLNAASYDGEILHADAYRPCRTCAGFYIYRGRRYKNNDIFPKMRADKPRLCCGESPQATGRSVRPYAVGLYQPVGCSIALGR